MNWLSLTTSPALTLLFKWTWLLAAGWVADWILRRRHARWRVILWRGILCGALVLPLTEFFRVPGITIPIAAADSASVEPVASPSAAVTAKVATSPAPASEASRTATAAIAALPSADLMPPPVKTHNIRWRIVLWGVWAIGCALAIARLVWLTSKLSRLREASCIPEASLRAAADQIKQRLQVHREFEVCVSDQAASPFVCGLRKPTIVLPRVLAVESSQQELFALLSHEVAHLRRNDLWWCVSWRWMKAICWFHPLVWCVPAAHNLACEQEADRLASGQLDERESYAPMLARLALRVLALPAAETELTVNGGSQIAWRLKHLGRAGVSAWNWRYSAAAIVLVGSLLVLTGGCRCSRSRAASTANTNTVNFSTVTVTVQDEQGNPLAGAAILPRGFRVKGTHAADAYGWNTNLFGAPESALTDTTGKARLKYPVDGIPEEKELTGEVLLKVSHPEFVPLFLQGYSVDTREQPIRLKRGIQLEVSGYIGSERQVVHELAPSLNEELVQPEDWVKKEHGVYAFQKLSAGSHIIQLMGRLASGELVFSDSFAFDAEPGKPCRFALEMKPGIRVEGRLDARVPRPVQNGRVIISVRPKQYPAWNNYADVDALMKKYPHVHNWKSYRTIAEDGTFLFESVPPGGLDVIVHGDGFCSQSGGDFSQRNAGKLQKVPGFALPQAFSLEAPTTKIEVVTEATATLELTAKTRFGRPIEGATVWVNPNVVRMGGIFGNVGESDEARFRTLTALPHIPYHATTDKNGVAVLPNIPATDRGIEVFHADYQVPLQEPKGWRDRHLRASFSPGETNRYKLKLESKGKDFIGSN